MQWHWQWEPAPRDPWTNMAQDAALLARLIEGKQTRPTISLYCWDRPCVSIGRLQNEEAVKRLYPDLACVRRPTGGRAVVHGQDLTITVATRSCWLPDTEEKDVLTSYRQIISGLLAALNECGIPAVFGTIHPHRWSVGAVNCFDIVASCDLVDSRNGRKIAGSAQRREQGAILQQTSLPLELLPTLDIFVPQLQRKFQQALQVESWTSPGPCV